MLALRTVVMMVIPSIEWPASGRRVDAGLSRPAQPRVGVRDDIETHHSAVPARAARRDLPGQELPRLPAQCLFSVNRRSTTTLRLNLYEPDIIPHWYRCGISFNGMERTGALLSIVLPLGSVCEIVEMRSLEVRDTCRRTTRE